MPKHPLFCMSIHAFATLLAFTVLLSGCANSQVAAPGARAFVYVSNGGDNQLSVYRMDEVTGELAHVQTIDAGGNVGSQALHPTQRSLYVALRDIKAVGTFVINPVTGMLTHVATTPVMDNSAYLHVDPTGDWLFTASYLGNKVGVYPIAPDLTLMSDAVQIIDTDRNPHSIAITPDGDHVLFPCTGADRIWQMRWNARAGRMTPNGAGKVTVGEQDGPRHFAFHPSGKFVYFVNEKSSTVTAFHYDDKVGTISPIHSLSTLPADFTAHNFTADIHVTPDGLYLYATNRGHNSLAGYAIDTQTGRLTFIDRFETEDTPREFDIDPTGRFVYAAGENSDKLAAYRLDSKTGRLTRFATYEVGKNPSWVKVVRFQ